MKKLYSFTVLKETEVEKSVETEEGKLIKKEIEKIPCKFFLKKPSQQEITESSATYAAKINELMAKGIFPAALMAKFYEKNGGLFTDEEVERRTNLAKELGLQTEAYLKIITKKEDDKTTEDLENVTSLTKSIDEIYKQLQDYKIREDSAFANTAEVLARNHIIFWWFLNMLYKEISPEVSEPVFGTSKDFKKLEEKYYELEEKEDKFYSELFARASKLVALWYAGEASTQEDFLQYDDITTEPETSEELVEKSEPATK